MALPTIGRALQPNVAGGQPRARPVPGLGAAIAEVGAAGMELALAQKRREEDEAARHRENRLREARAEAAERLGTVRARTKASRAFGGMTEGFNTEAAAIKAEMAARFADDEELAERFNVVFDELRVPHSVGVVSREMALRAEDDRTKLERDSNRMLREYSAENDPKAREAIAKSAAAMIDDAAEKGIITPEQAAGAKATFTAAVEKGELAGALREDPHGMLKALEAGEFDLTPVEREKMIAQAQAAIKAKDAEAERDRLEKVDGQLVTWLREDPETGAKELEKKGALGLDDGARERWRTRMLEEIDKRKSDAEKEAAEPLRATAIEMVEAEPDRFLDMTERGFFDGLPAAERSRYKVLAQREIERRAEAERKAADKETKERHATIDAAVDVAEKALMAGRPLPDPQALSEASIGTPSEARVKALIDMDRRVQILRGKPASERERMIEAVRAKTPGTDVETREIDLLQRVHDEMRKAEEADIWKFREDNGYGPAPEVDFGNPESLRIRLTLARQYAADHEVDVKFFSEREAAAVTKLLNDGERDTEDKLSVLTAVTGALGADAGVALAEVGLKEPVYGRAGFLMAYGGDPAAATAVVTGYEALKRKEGPTVAAAVRDRTLAEIGWDRALPSRLGAFRENILEAARAHYAATMRSGTDGDEITDEDKRAAFARSVNAVLGGRTVRGQEYGGIQEVNGWEVVLPPDMGAGMVETLLKAVSDEQFADSTRSKSLPVYASGNELKPDQRRGLVLQMAGPNQYLVGILRNGEFLALRDGVDPRRPAILDLGVLRQKIAGAIQ